MSNSALGIDALVVGCGFGGINAAYRLVKRGFSVRCIDMAGNIGGTWYWNKYPGAMSDTESYLYRYSWDKEDLQSYAWTHRYLSQPDILAYLGHVADKHQLRSLMDFGVEMKSARWDDRLYRWIVVCSNDQTFKARYLINCLGVLSQPHYPDFHGICSFSGSIVHSSRWPDDLALQGKKVGIVGNGSTGVQIMTAIAPLVGELISFQRHPQYSVPSGQGPVLKTQRANINRDYETSWNRVWNSSFGLGIIESDRKTMDADEAERNAAFQEAWDAGNGFQFMLGAFGDLAIDKTANEEACKFLRHKIDQIVTDPHKAGILKPKEPYARRPICDLGYYQIFNRSNVDVVDLLVNPIRKIIPSGVELSDGTKHDLDILIFATGFDAVDGNYKRVQIMGRHGNSLSQHWADGPTAYAAVSCAGFPNMFLVSGPQGPFANFPPVIESELDLIMACVEAAESAANHHSDGLGGADCAIEALPGAEATWSTFCTDVAKSTLFWSVPSWIIGTNVDKKGPRAKFYLGGLASYREYVKKIINNNMEGFVTRVFDVANDNKAS
jgi:cation diffusion facilitator CzcD-associated flavoprotein CzcO